LPPEIFEPADIGGALRDDPLNDEKVRLVDALGRSRGNRARAARLLGISRAAVYPTSKSIPKKNSLTCFSRDIVETTLRHFTVAVRFAISFSIRTTPA
jgi:DNA-binding NtrC family response regulator